MFLSIIKGYEVAPRLALPWLTQKNPKLGLLKKMTGTRALIWLGSACMQGLRGRRHRWCEYSENWHKDVLRGL